MVIPIINGKDQQKRKNCKQKNCNIKARTHKKIQHQSIKRNKKKGTKIENQNKQRIKVVKKQ